MLYKKKAHNTKKYIFLYLYNQQDDKKNLQGQVETFIIWDINYKLTLTIEFDIFLW